MINVSDEEQIIKALQSKRNIFITGSAGSGKTYLAKQYSKKMRNVALTATTGIAAMNIGGETIHRFLGIDIFTRPEDLNKIIGKWEKIKNSRHPWDLHRIQTIKSLETIVIDEISMLRRDQFELIDATLGYLKDNSLPFGGVQMVVIGDFFQLPPVVTGEDSFKYNDLKESFCFQSDIWNYANFECFNLTSNYRQDDPIFINMLNKIRVGQIDDDIEKILDSRVNANLNISMEPIKIFSHKIKVYEENMNCLKKLLGDKYLSEADFIGKEYDVNILAKECPAEVKLYYCTGAQVMMLTNDPMGKWVNGSMGIIVNTNPIEILLSNGRTIEVKTHTWERIVPQFDKLTKNIKHVIVAKMTQYPFKLAWSNTIHKTQGLTLDYIDIDLSKCFASGQAYVALSRARTLNGITLRGWNKNSIKADSEVLKFYNF